MRSGAGPTVRWADRMSSLVCPVVRLRSRVLGGACREDGFVDNVARVHGCDVPG